MNKFIINIGLWSLATVVSAGMTGCNDDILSAYENQAGSSVDNEISFNEDGTMNIPISVEIPSFPTVSTRGEMGYVPNNEGLSLFVVVFATETGNILQCQQISVTSTTDIKKDEVHEKGDSREFRKLISFKATLNGTDVPAAIQLIATDQPDLLTQFDGIGNRNNLKTIYTNYTTEDGREFGRGAYWARVDLGTRILNALDNDEKADDKAKEEALANADLIKNKLQHVPMVRNFLRISAETAETVTSFKITGLYVINTPDRGSVVPYMHEENQSADPEVRDNHGFVYFYDKVDENGNIVDRNSENFSNYKSRSYSKISSLGYIGEPPAQTQVLTKERVGKPDEIDNRYAVYLYERPYRSEDRTYVVLSGKRVVDGQETGDEMFYKIDLGAQQDDEIGTFGYFNLIRNFDYRIRVLEADPDGYATLEEAKNGIVFNNIGAAVEVHSLNSISNGKETIIVNKTSFVITENNKNRITDIIGQYIVGNGNYESEELKIKLGDGNLLSLVDENGTLNGNEKTWQVKINENVTFTGEPQQQVVTVYRGKNGDGTYGLYREITFTLIQYFPFEHVDTYAGHYEDFDDVPWDFDDEKVREVGQGVDAPLTLFFQIPSGLPEAIFPLEFVIESDRQNIQNAYVGNAAVKTVAPNGSLFWSDGNVATARIQYVKTLTWDEYKESASSDLPTTGSRIIRCRFLTTTDLAQDGIGNADGTSRTTLRIYNEYFNLGEDQFTRNSQTSDPSPVIADFNGDAWSAMLSTLRGSHDRLTANNNSTGNLVLIENGPNSMGSGTDGSGINFITTSDLNDTFRYTVTYDGKVARKIRVEVMATDASGNPVTSIVSCANNVTTGLTFTQSKDETTTPFETYVYEAEAPVSATSVTRTISIKPSVTGQRFYKINIYPRWDETGN